MVDRTVKCSSQAPATPYKSSKNESQPNKLRGDIARSKQGLR